MPNLNRKNNWLMRSPSRRKQRQKPKKFANSEGFWAKRGWRSVAKGKERYNALCRAARSAGALVILEQGRQGLKVPKLSRNFKNCYLNSTIMLNVTRWGANQLMKLIKGGVDQVWNIQGVELGQWGEKPKQEVLIQGYLLSGVASFCCRKICLRTSRSTSKAWP